MTTIDFVYLDTCLNDNIIWGMYDKKHTPNEKHIIYERRIPENAISVPVKTDGYKLHTILNRNMFPYKKSDGTDQYYFGWYVLIPFNKQILSMDENGGSPMTVKDFKLLNEDGTDLVIESKGQKYNVYGKFNVARTSNNWYLHIDLQDKK